MSNIVYLPTRKTQLAYIKDMERIKQAKLRKAAVEYWDKLPTLKKECLD